MRRYTLIIIIALMATASHLAAQEMTIEYFYDKLSPYGHWAEMDELGWVWQPASIGTDWRPYSDGSWVYTNEGWSFNCSAPWSWAAYHYGRWSFQGTYGWVWVPGTEWAPAWVAWRKSEQYIGWAALPPAIQWTPENGLGTQLANWNSEIDLSGWCFVEPKYFTETNLPDYLQSPSSNQNLFNETRDITNYTLENNHIVDHAVSVNDVEQYTQKKVTAYRITEINTLPQSSTTIHQNQIMFYRPNIIRAKINRTPVNIIITAKSARRDEQLRKNARTHRRIERKMEKRENKVQSEQNKNNKEVNQKVRQKLKERLQQKEAKRGQMEWQNKHQSE